MRGIVPSWEHYGTHDSSAYPELWEGCIYACAPCLGPSWWLQDLSGSGASVICDTTLMTQWAINSGQWSLYFPYFDTNYSRVIPLPKRLLSSNDLTIAATAVFYSTNSYNGIFSCAVSEPYAIGLRRTNGKLTFYTDGVLLNSPSALALNVVQSVVGSNIRSKNYKGIWSNGELLASTSAETITLTDSDQVVVCGDYLTGYDRGMAGWLFDLRIYNRELGREEMAVLSGQIGAAYVPRRRRRFYSIPTAAFLAAWARNRSAQILGGGLR